MKAPSPSTKLSRLAGGGSPSIGLRLGLGSVSGCWPRPGFGHVKCSFTFLQLQEMEHQALIFKYMVAGLPVPFHLVLPIWKSVANSFDGVHGGLSLHYPSFLAGGPLSFDYRHRMESEPGRCRRTDGKKWRCSKDVVPDQKYCEQHMHRGRQRSRKLVEASQTSTVAASSSINTTPKTISTSKSIVNPNNNLSISIPVSSQLLTNNNSSINNKLNHNHNNNSSSNDPPGLDLFRKRVLQVLGSSSSWFGYKNSMETEPGRCRRTDGRKWRCCKNVVPDQKYCSRHMHRGSRKHVEASGTTASTTSTVTPIATIVTTTTPSVANAVADTESKPGNGDSEHVNSSSKLLISITDTPPNQ